MLILLKWNAIWLMWSSNEDLSLTGGMQMQDDRFYVELWLAILHFQWNASEHSSVYVKCY